VARGRFQSGYLFKRGKRRKVWVARWHETAVLENGRVKQLRRSVVLGTVAELPKKGDAQVRLEDYLRPINQGTGRPEAFIAFGTFVETQWKTLVLPTFKRSTQPGYKTVLNLHLLPRWRDWRLRDIEQLAIQQGSRRSSASDVAGRRCAIRGYCSRAFSKRLSNTDISTLHGASSSRRRGSKRNPRSWPATASQSC
jgi:hypothetical protein